jgi:Capsule polysaccharide biosynthesis protein
VNQPVKAIVLEWHEPMLIEVLAELKAHGWQTLYCVSYQLEDHVRRHFPEAVYHDTFDARYGRPPGALADLPWSGIDQATAEALGYAQVIALKQMDRMEIMGGFATHDRFIHFHRLASYWSAVFDRLRPDVLLMPTAPHVVYDYIAYALAKRRGIRTILFEYVTTEGLLMAIDRFEDGLPPLTAAYRKLTANPPSGPVVLSDRMEDYWRRLQGHHTAAMPQWTREFLVRAEAARAARIEEEKRAEAEAKVRLETEETKKRLEAEAKRLAEANRPTNPILRALGLARAAQPPMPVASPAPEPEQPAPPPPTTDGHYGGRFYFWTEAPDDLARSAEQYRRKHQEAFIRRYDELAVMPDLSVPYIYVPLHMQPERSTNPNGGVFDDQHLMINMIASVLPSGWRIYVKEHPSQFAPQIASERGRWPTQYDEMIAHPSVSLVLRTTPSFDLIDNAQAVASIVGTSCWEALARRVPALVFGEAWYKGCPGSYTVRTGEDCRQAVTRIAAGERPDPESVRRFLKVAEDTAFVGYLGHEDAAIAGIDEATNIRRFTQAIVACYCSSHQRTLLAAASQAVR